MEQNHIFGIRAVIEAIKAGKTIDKVFLHRELKLEAFSELKQLMDTNKIAYSRVPVEKLNRLTRKNHQGVVAVISPIVFEDFETLVQGAMERTEPALFVLLDHLSDIRNIGAIMRTCECTGVTGIIIPKNGASVSADMVKTSAGAIFNIPICKVENMVDAIYFLQGSGVKVVAATEKTPNLLYDVSMEVPLAIVMGAEDKGISPSILKIVDDKAKLPMFGEIGSLNVSVACGVFLYEVVRQRNFLSK